MNTTRQPNLPLPVFSREIRLGLVLYGGVSLAVYMNGVCQEFYNAIRGRGIYKLLKALTDSDIVVDIVSGTSAGGVNGVLLSHAIANSNLEKATNFKEFADLWREQGDIQKLLRKSRPKGENFSFLDGEGFYQDRFQEAFQEPTFPSRGDWYSDFGELDLFITATDFNGKINQTFDNVGKVIDVKDHKAFFHLRYRQDQAEYIDNPFRIDPDNQIAETALAKLCRATSCFPVAFPVVTVQLSPEENEKHDTDDIKVDRKLVEWGQLQDRDLDPSYQNNKKNYPIYLIDGGVLDNRPFTYTVETIYGRIAYRPVERVLFYLDPTPDRFFGDATQTKVNMPPVDKVLIGALTGLPRYQSIKKDLQSIEEGNCKVTRYKLLKDTILESLDITCQKPRQPSEENAYIKCRLLNLLDRSIRTVLVRKSPFETKQDCQSDFLDKTAEILKNLKDFQEFTTASKNRFLENIYHNVQLIDVSFLIRKYCFLLDRIAALSDQKIQQLSPSHSPHSAKFYHLDILRQFVALRYLSYQMSWQLELLKLIQKSLDQILNYYDFSEIAGTEDFSQFNLERIYHFLIVFHRTLLNTNFKHNLQDLGELSSGDLLIAYYEFFKKIHFPQEIDFDNDNVNWSNLKLLLPEQESSLSKKIFEQIYQLPLCKVLTLQGLRDKKQEINRIKREIQHSLSTNNARKDEYNWSEVNILIAESSEILQIDLASIDPQDTLAQDSTILQVIEQNSRIFIDSLGSYIDREDKQKLQLYFECFESIDQILYSYEYLSDIVTKNTIKLARISPRDADKGYGAKFLNNVKKETPSEKKSKILGHQYNAFGGFFKKFYRSNDLLWGRMDGLNQLVDTLINPKSLQNFILFKSRINEDWRHRDYIRELVQESLPKATEKEREEIINYLEKFICSPLDYEQNYQREFKHFVENIVKAGQREILWHDFPHILEDLDIAEMKRLEEKLKSQGKQPNKTIDLLTERQQKLIFKDRDLAQVLQELEQEENLGEAGEKTAVLLDLLFQKYEDIKNQFTIQSHYFWVKTIFSTLRKEHNWFGAIVLTITLIIMQIIKNWRCLIPLTLISTLIIIALLVRTLWSLALLGL
jgi:Protein of unknown function (DUF3376)/Patatin-like phospholipase